MISSIYFRIKYYIIFFFIFYCFNRSESITNQYCLNSNIYTLLNCTFTSNPTYSNLVDKKLNNFYQVNDGYDVYGRANRNYFTKVSSDSYLSGFSFSFSFTLPTKLCSFEILIEEDSTCLYPNLVTLLAKKEDNPNFYTPLYYFHLFNYQRLNQTTLQAKYPDYNTVTSKKIFSFIYDLPSNIQNYTDYSIVISELTQIASAETARVMPSENSQTEDSSMFSSVMDQSKVSTNFFYTKLKINEIIFNIGDSDQILTSGVSQSNEVTSNFNRYFFGSPSLAPTLFPSNKPTSKPVTFSPSNYPFILSSINPTSLPSVLPSFPPTEAPSFPPTESPSIPPTESPSIPPSESPSYPPTESPSEFPSAIPSFNPSFSPTKAPFLLSSKPKTFSPTISETIWNNNDDNGQNSDLESDTPTLIPTSIPTISPSTSLPTSISDPFISITASSPIYNIESSILLIATALLDYNYSECIWTYSSDLISNLPSLSSISFSPVLHTYNNEFTPTSNDISKYTNVLKTYTDSLKFIYPLAYTRSAGSKINLAFTLSCSHRFFKDISLSNSITIPINLPPYDGTFSVSPNKGFEIETPFLFNSNNFIDEDLPLKYEFGIINFPTSYAIPASNISSQFNDALLSNNYHLISTLKSPLSISLEKKYVMLDDTTISSSNPLDLLGSGYFLTSLTPSSTTKSTFSSIISHQSSTNSTEIIAYCKVTDSLGSSSYYIVPLKLFRYLQSNSAKSNNLYSHLSSIVKSFTNSISFQRENYSVLSSLITVSTQLTCFNMTVNCTSLNRYNCFSTPMTCGHCLDGYFGEEKDSNTPCYDYSLLHSLVNESNNARQYLEYKNLDNQDKIIDLFKESNDNDFESFLFNYFSYFKKNCTNNCFGNGECKLYNKTSNNYQDFCPLFSLDCEATCVCNPDFYGAFCHLSLNKYQEKSDMTSLFISTLDPIYQIWTFSLSTYLLNNLYLTLSSREGFLNINLNSALNIFYYSIYGLIDSSITSTESINPFNYPFEEKLKYVSVSDISSTWIDQSFSLVDIFLLSINDDEYLINQLFFTLRYLSLILYKSSRDHSNFSFIYDSFRIGKNSYNQTSISITPLEANYFKFVSEGSAFLDTYRTELISDSTLSLTLLKLSHFIPHHDEFKSNLLLLNTVKEQYKKVFIFIQHKNWNELEEINNSTSFHTYCSPHYSKIMYSVTHICPHSNISFTHICNSTNVNTLISSYCPILTPVCHSFTISNDQYINCRPFYYYGDGTFFECNLNIHDEFYTTYIPSNDPDINEVNTSPSLNYQSIYFKKLKSLFNSLSLNIYSIKNKKVKIYPNMIKDIKDVYHMLEDSIRLSFNKKEQNFDIFTHINKINSNLSPINSPSSFTKHSSKFSQLSTDELEYSQYALAVEFTYNESPTFKKMYPPPTIKRNQDNSILYFFLSFIIIFVFIFFLYLISTIATSVNETSKIDSIMNNKYKINTKLEYDTNYQFYSLINSLSIDELFCNSKVQKENNVLNNYISKFFPIYFNQNLSLREKFFYEFYKNHKFFKLFSIKDDPFNFFLKCLTFILLIYSLYAFIFYFFLEIISQQIKCGENMTRTECNQTSENIDYYISYKTMSCHWYSDYTIIQDYNTPELSPIYKIDIETSGTCQLSVNSFTSSSVPLAIVIFFYTNIILFFILIPLRYIFHCLESPTISIECHLSNLENLIESMEKSVRLDDNISSNKKNILNKSLKNNSNYLKNTPNSSPFFFNLKLKFYNLLYYSLIQLKSFINYFDFHMFDLNAKVYSQDTTSSLNEKLLFNQIQFTNDKFLNYKKTIKKDILKYYSSYNDFINIKKQNDNIIVSENDNINNNNTFTKIFSKKSKNKLKYFPNRNLFNESINRAYPPHFYQKQEEAWISMNSFIEGILLLLLLSNKNELMKKKDPNHYSNNSRKKLMNLLNDMRLQSKFITNIRNYYFFKLAWGFDLKKLDNYIYQQHVLSMTFDKTKQDNKIKEIIDKHYENLSLLEKEIEIIDSKSQLLSEKLVKNANKFNIGIEIMYYFILDLMDSSSSSYNFYRKKFIHDNSNIFSSYISTELILSMSSFSSPISSLFSLNSLPKNLMKVSVITKFFLYTFVILLDITLIICVITYVKFPSLFYFLFSGLFSMLFIFIDFLFLESLSCMYLHFFLPFLFKNDIEKVRNLIIRFVNKVFENSIILMKFNMKNKINNNIYYENQEYDDCTVKNFDDNEFDHQQQNYMDLFGNEPLHQSSSNQQLPFSSSTFSSNSISPDSIKDINNIYLNSSEYLSVSTQLAYNFPTYFESLLVLCFQSFSPGYISKKWNGDGDKAFDIINEQFQGNESSIESTINLSSDSSNISLVSKASFYTFKIKSYLNNKNQKYKNLFFKYFYICFNKFVFILSLIPFSVQEFIIKIFSYVFLYVIFYIIYDNSLTIFSSFLSSLLTIIFIFMIYSLFYIKNQRRNKHENDLSHKNQENCSKIYPINDNLSAIVSDNLSDYLY